MLKLTLQVLQLWVEAYLTHSMIMELISYLSSSSIVEVKAYLTNSIIVEVMDYLSSSFIVEVKITIQVQQLWK